MINQSVSVILSDDGCTVYGDGAAADDNGVVITESGTYILSGTLSNGFIKVSAETDTKNSACIRRGFDSQ